MGELRRIRDFKAAVDPASANELRRQLVKLEDNVSDMGDRLRQGAMARLAVKQREAQGSSLTVAAGQSLGIVSTVARVQLERPSAADAGKFLAICKGAGAASNTDVLAPAGSLINGAALYTIVTSGCMLLVYCDGMDFWAVN